MNWVDWAIIFVILMSTAHAAAEGLFSELFGLAGLVFGLVFAFWEYDRLAPWFLQFVNSQTTANLAAFLVIFIGTMLLAGVVGRLARWAVKQVGLGWVDRLLGTVIGFIRGVAFVAVTLLAVAAFSPETKAVSESRLAPYFLLVARTATWVAPQEMRYKVREGVVALRGAAQTKAKDGAPLSSAGTGRR
jgi:membrane protein required for colicin V production